MSYLVELFLSVTTRKKNYEIPGKTCVPPCGLIATCTRTTFADHQSTERRSGSSGRIRERKPKCPGHLLPNWISQLFLSLSPSFPLSFFCTVAYPSFCFALRFDVVCQTKVSIFLRYIHNIVHVQRYCGTVYKCAPLFESVRRDVVRRLTELKRARKFSRRFEWKNAGFFGIRCMQCADDGHGRWKVISEATKRRGEDEKRARHVPVCNRKMMGGRNERTGSRPGTSLRNWTRTERNWNGKGWIKPGCR